MLAWAMGKLMACRLGVEQEYDELNRGKPAVIPPYGLHAWRRKWIILLRGKVLSCNVTGIFYAYCGSVGPASVFWRRLFTLVVQDQRRKYYNSDSVRQSTDLASRPFLYCNVDTSIGIDLVGLRGEVSAQLSSLVWAATSVIPLRNGS